MGCRWWSVYFFFDVWIWLIVEYVDWYSGNFDVFIGYWGGGDGGKRGERKDWEGEGWKGVGGRELGVGFF